MEPVATRLEEWLPAANKAPISNQTTPTSIPNQRRRARRPRRAYFCSTVTLTIFPVNAFAFAL